MACPPHAQAPHVGARLVACYPGMLARPVAPRDAVPVPFEDSPPGLNLAQRPRRVIAGAVLGDRTARAALKAECLGHAGDVADRNHPVGDRPPATAVSAG